jgi:protein-tyrosine phosphatase
MVCLGNICRSPLAEGILQQKIIAHGLDWQVQSAGTNGLHNGQPPHHLSQKVALQNNIDISQQRSVQFVATDINKYDKIYAMAKDVLKDIKQIGGKNYDNNKVDLLLNELDNATQQDVPDPWYGGEEGYHKVFELIDTACENIIIKYVLKNKKENE